MPTYNVNAYASYKKRKEKNMAKRIKELLDEYAKWPALELDKAFYKC